MPSQPGRRALLGAVIGGMLLPGLSGCSPDPYRRPTAGLTPTVPVGPRPSDVAPNGGRSVVFQDVAYRVPHVVRRVVTLGDACLQPALDVGAPVVATSPISPATVPPSRREALRALPVLGRGREVDPITVDAVLDRAPDLVLMTAGSNDAVARGLSDAGIAVVQVRTDGAYGGAWRDRVGGVARLVGAPSTTVDAWQAALRRRTEAVRSRYGTVLADARVVLLRAWDTTRITAYGPASVVGELYTQAGARFVPAVGEAGTGTPSEHRDDSLGNVTRYLDGADVVMLASDYAGGLDAFTGGSLANSDPVTSHVRRTGAVVAPAGVLTVTSYAQAEFLVESFERAVAELVRRRSGAAT